MAVANIPVQNTISLAGLMIVIHTLGLDSQEFRWTMINHRRKYGMSQR